MLLCLLRARAAGGCANQQMRNQEQTERDSVKNKHHEDERAEALSGHMCLVRLRSIPYYAVHLLSSHVIARLGIRLRRARPKRKGVMLIIIGLVTRES